MSFNDLLKMPKIERGIPIPARGRSGKWKEFIEKLSVGDSFIIKGKYMAGNIYTCARALGIRTVARKIEGDIGGGWRIWIVQKGMEIPKANPDREKPETTEEIEQAMKKGLKKVGLGR